MSCHIGISSFYSSLIIQHIYTKINFNLLTDFHACSITMCFWSKVILSSYVFSSLWGWEPSCILLTPSVIWMLQNKILIIILAMSCSRFSSLIKTNRFWVFSESVSICGFKSWLIFLSEWLPLILVKGLNFFLLDKWLFESFKLLKLSYSRVIQHFNMF